MATAANIAGPLDRRVHVTHTLGWAQDAVAKAYMVELVRRANPILHARGWRVLEMKEFYPRDKRLLGLNVNRGQEVCIRFRHPEDQGVFFPLEAVIGTMIHELCHCKISPHNKLFWALYHEIVHSEEERDLQMAVGTASVTGRVGEASTLIKSGRVLGSNEMQRGAGRVLGGAQVRNRPLRGILAAAALARQGQCVHVTTMSSSTSVDLDGATDAIEATASAGCSQSLAAGRRLRDEGPDTSLSEYNPTSGAPWRCPRCCFENHALMFPICELCSDVPYAGAYASGSTDAIDAEISCGRRSQPFVIDD